MQKSLCISDLVLHKWFFKKNILDVREESSSQIIATCKIWLFFVVVCLHDFITAGECSEYVCLHLDPCEIGRYTDTGLLWLGFFCGHLRKYMET